MSVRHPNGKMAMFESFNIEAFQGDVLSPAYFVDEYFEDIISNKERLCSFGCLTV